MKDKMTNQTISGGFIFVIGMAMFTLLGGNYKKPILFGSIYVIAIIIQLFLMKKIRKGNRSTENKKWVNRAFVFLGITCWFKITWQLKYFMDIDIIFCRSALFIFHSC